MGISTAMDLGPDETQAALGLLSQELTNQGNQFQMVAEAKVATTNLKTQSDATVIDAASMVPNQGTQGRSTGMDQIYSNLAANSQPTVIHTFSGRPVDSTGAVIPPVKPVARVAPTSGGPIPTSGTIPTSFTSTAPYVQNPTDRQVALRTYEQTSGPQNVTALGFDVEKATRELNNHKGSERNVASLQLLSNIDTAIANRQAAIRQQAQLESGIADADAAVKRLTEAAIAKRLEPSSTIQVVNAQAVQQQAIAASNARANNLIAQDAEIMKLTASRGIVGTMIQKTFAQTEKEEALTETVTDQEVMNSRILNGTKGNDFEDRLMTAKLKAADPTFRALISFNPDTAPILLMSDNPIIRAKAQRLSVERDKALNKYDPLSGKGIPSTADQTFVSAETERIQRARTEDLIKEHYGKDAEGILKDYRGTSGAARVKLDADLKATMLPAMIEKSYGQQYRNANTWAGTNVAADQPLGKIITELKQTHKNGVVPMRDVVERFVTDRTLRGADGNILGIKERLAILDSTVNDTATTELKSVLNVRPSSVVAKIKEEMKNTAYRAYIVDIMYNVQIGDTKIPTSPVPFMNRLMQ